VHTEIETVFDAAISMWIRSRRTNMQRRMVMPCERAFVFPPETVNTDGYFSWHHGEVREIAQKELPRFR